MLVAIIIVSYVIAGLLIFRGVLTYKVNREKKKILQTFPTKAQVETERKIKKLKIAQREAEINNKTTDLSEKYKELLNRGLVHEAQKVEAQISKMLRDRDMLEYHLDDLYRYGSTAEDRIASYKEDAVFEAVIAAFWWPLIPVYYIVIGAYRFAMGGANTEFSSTPGEMRAKFELLALEEEDPTMRKNYETLAQQLKEIK